MNKLQVIRAPSKYIKEPHLVILIDGKPLDLLIAQLVNNDWYEGLVTTLDDCLWRLEDRPLVWDRILPEDRALAPILVCSDDLDFSCTVVNVEVVVDQNSVRWERVGLGDPAEPTAIHWWSEVAPFHFTRENYARFLADCRSLKADWWIHEGGRS
jgi:hypothetical protein